MVCITITLIDCSGVHKGGLIKGGLAMCASPLCNCNTLGSVFNVEIENMPN